MVKRVVWVLRSCLFIVMKLSRKIFKLKEIWINMSARLRREIRIRHRKKIRTSGMPPVDRCLTRLLRSDQNLAEPPASGSYLGSDANYGTGPTETSSENPAVSERPY